MPHHAARLDKLIAMIGAGQLRTLIDRTVPFDQAADALSYQAAGRAKGKVIVQLMQAG